MFLLLSDKKNTNQRGFAALLSTMIIMAVILIVVAGLSLVTLIEQKISANIAHSAQAYFAAESGIEDSLYRLIQGHDYTAANNLNVGAGAAAITISDVAGQKNILAQGQKNARFRSLQIKLNTGDSGQGTAFYYGVQVGEGGLIMDNNSRVEGSIYSNGSIQGSNGATITGDAWVANPALSANQQSQANDTNFVFGQASPVIDAGQSFTPSIAGNLIKVSLLLKKFGSPTNKTVRILTDDNGRPSKTLVSSGAYGSLMTSQVSGSYAWVDVTLNAPATLQAGVKYWIVIDSSLNEDNYLIWGKDSTDSYGGGTGQSSPNWNASSPIWSDANGDLAFRAWFGQPNNFLDNVVVGANAHANTIRHSTVTGDAYFQTIHDTTVIGTPYVDSTDPTLEAMPISESTINNWKTQAEEGGVITGDYSLDAGATGTLGPKKIIGNLTVSNSGDLTLSGPVFVTGNINIFNNAKIRLSASLGEYSTVLLTDGVVNVSNGCVFYGNANSYLLVLATKSGAAINIANNSDTALFYAPSGAIEVSNNAILKELTAYQIHLNNGAQVIYESGLASILFSAGVSGGGVWEVTSWSEVP